MLFPSLSYQEPVQYRLIYVLAVIFAFHNSLILFINSTYIERFVAPEVVGTLFMIGSSIAVLSFLFIAKVLRRVGNVRLTIWLVVLDILALIALGLTASPAMAIVALVLFLFINPLIYLNLDIFSETLIGDDENSTGHKRGLVLALISGAAMVAPLTITHIAGPQELHLERVYLVAAGVFSIFLMIILSRFNNFTDPAYHEVRVFDALRDFWKNHNIRFSLFAQFILQLAFSWLVIYIPLYLISVMGLTWADIGIAIAVGTIAYVLFEFPVGYIADNYIGEKEMMTFGFIIMSATFIALSFITSSSVFLWMLMMFLMRTGASLVETTVESYFFKHTKGTDTNYLSFFRLTRPLAIVAGGLLGSVSLLFLPFSYIFIVMGCALMFGVYSAYHIEDTR